MSETRRQVFKVSVLSTLGVASAVLAGCKPSFTDSKSPSVRYQFEPIFSLSADRKYWYILAVDPEDSQKRVRIYQTDVSNVPDRPFDTVEVFNHIPPDKLTPKPGWISFGIHHLKADEGGYLSQGDGDQAYMMANKWNEIPLQ